MNIVIIGAGDIGAHLAHVFSKGEDNVILVDCDGRKLEAVAGELDIATKLGSGTDWQLLDDLLELAPDLFIALTDKDEVNLLSCAIAKNLGYPQTIARVRDTRYFNRTRLDFERLFYVDHIIGPELLAAQDLYKAVVTPGVKAVTNFAHGAVQMRQVAIPSNWRKGHVLLKDLQIPQGVMLGLISRWTSRKGGSSGPNVIFPHGNDSIQAGDEVTFIGEIGVMNQVNSFVGLSTKSVHSVVVAGGSITALNLCRMLERDGYGVKVIDKDHRRCSLLSEELTYSTVLHHDATDKLFLEAEGVGNADVFLACTKQDDTNILLALLAKELGCPKVVCILSDTHLIPLVTEYGISHAVSHRVAAANRILSEARPGTVQSMVSLYENQAEIMEVRVSLDSKIVGIPLCELGPQLPKDFLIAVIQNRGRTMIANGSRILSPGDTMIVISSPKHIKEFHKLF